MALSIAASAQSPRAARRPTDTHAHAGLSIDTRRAEGGALAQLNLDWNQGSAPTPGQLVGGLVVGMFTVEGTNEIDSFLYDFQANQPM
jgi:hypothetical protein